MIEDKLLVLLWYGKISRWFSSIGQEAISAEELQQLSQKYLQPEDFYELVVV